MSAGIATTELIFNNDYHLVDWFGNVGSDMFKALVQYGAGEAMLLVIGTLNVPILLGAALFVASLVLIEVYWGDFEVSEKIVEGLKHVTTE